MSSATTFSGTNPRLHANVVADRNAIFTKRDPKAHAASKTDASANKTEKDEFSKLKTKFRKAAKAAAPDERWQVAKFLWRNKVIVGASLIVGASALAATHMLWLAPTVAFLGAHPIGWAIIGAAAGVAAVVGLIYVVRQLKASAKQTSSEKLLKILEDRVVKGEAADATSRTIADQSAFPGVPSARRSRQDGPPALPQGLGAESEALQQNGELPPRELYPTPDSPTLRAGHVNLDFTGDSSGDASSIGGEHINMQAPGNQRAGRDAR